MIARSVSKSRAPVSGSWVVIAQRPSRAVTRRIASPSAIRPPIQSSSSCGIVPSSSMSIRELEPEGGCRWIRVGPDLDERADDEAVDEAVVVVDQVEAAILGHAVVREVDLGRVLEGEAPDGRDREADNSTHVWRVRCGSVPAPRRAVVAAATARTIP